MNKSKVKKGMQIVYLSHGGGPLPILGDSGHMAMVNFMRKLPTYLHRPEAIIVISAHWEERAATIFSTSNVPLLYDYYGFPEQAYRIKYDAQGNSTLVKRIQTLFSNQNINSEVDIKRGFDHGVYIPLMLSYPEADIPIIQVSLLYGLDPAAHLLLGKALQPLKDENILVIGSGFSFHNLSAFFKGEKNGNDLKNDSFQDWLIETCTGEFSNNERETRLIEWEQAPAARYCHPREDHLLPLHVCVGLAEKNAELIFDEVLMNKRTVAFSW